MPRRKYKTDPGVLLAQGQEIVARTKDAKFQHKVEMVNLVLGGIPPSELCKYCAESKNTITLWVKTADERGFEALRDGAHTGRPPRLSDGQLAEIAEAVRGDEPERHGLRVWDGPSLSQFIRARFSVSLCVRQCQRILRALGFSLVRPQTFPNKAAGASREEREAFKKRSPRRRGTRTSPWRSRTRSTSR